MNIIPNPRKGEESPDERVSLTTVIEVIFGIRDPLVKFILKNEGLGMTSSRSVLVI
jgi:hypothetical protein